MSLIKHLLCACDAPWTGSWRIQKWTNMVPVTETQWDPTVPHPCAHLQSPGEGIFLVRIPDLHSRKFYFCTFREGAKKAILFKDFPGWKWISWGEIFFCFLLIYINIYLNNEIVWVTFTLYGGRVSSCQIKIFLIKWKAPLVILKVQQGLGTQHTQCCLQHFSGINAHFDKSSGTGSNVS